ncbi:sugar transporter SWEET1-like [Diadema antillarum]|uniref:sugar transporter SWEET1-like n=1 Tax=Diadema antillarum TaxID=105358 RepID=UPI003A88B588
MWLWYGFLCLDTAIIIVNIMGLTVQLIYISIYIYFREAKLRPIQLTIAGVAFMVGLYIYVSEFVPTRASSRKQVGLIASIVTILMYISPVCDIVHCIRVKSARTISVSMSLATLCSSSLWLTYGILLNDTFIALPNIPGLLSSVSRLIILWKFNGAGRLPAVTTLHTQVYFSLEETSLRLARKTTETLPKKATTFSPGSCHAIMSPRHLRKLSAAPLHRRPGTINTSSAKSPSSLANALAIIVSHTHIIFLFCMISNPTSHLTHIEV